MKKKIRPEDFAIGIFISEDGVDDLRVIARDKIGMRKAKTVCKTISPYLHEIEAKLESMGETLKTESSKNSE